MKDILKSAFSSISDLGALIILLLATKWGIVPKETFGGVIFAYFMGRGMIGGTKATFQAVMSQPPGPGSSGKSNPPLANSGPTTGVVMMLGAGIMETIRRAKGLG